MKKLTGTIAVVVALLSITIWQSCQSTRSSTASRVLKFNLTNGKGYDYETTINMDQEIMGQQVQMDMSSYYSMDVISDSGDTRTIRASIDRFKMKTGAAGMNFEIDTDKPFISGENNKDKQDSLLGMMNKLFGAIRHQNFTMTVNSEGKILDVKGFDDMAKRIVDSMGLEEDKKAEMMTQFNKQFNGEQVKGQFERFWNLFPNKEVKVGESWNRTSTIGGPMPGIYNSTYTVKEIEGDMVTLDEKTKVETKEQSLDLKGDITGTIIVDSKLGLVVSAEQDMNMKTEAGGMKFELKGKTRTKGKAR